MVERESPGKPTGNKARGVSCSRPGATRTWIPVLTLGLLLCAGLAFALAGGVGAAGPNEGPGTIVERARWRTLGDGRQVEVSVLVDSAIADPEAVLDTLAPRASAEAPGQVTAAFGQSVDRRKWAATDIPVQVAYNPAFDLPGVGGKPVVQWALAVWNAIPSQYFRFADAGNTTVTASLCGPDDPDGQNTVRFATDLPSGALGVTCSVSDGTFVDGIRRVTEFDLDLGAAVTWSTADNTPTGAYDLKTTVLHELGHALGLDHTTVSGAVMLAKLSAGQQRRVPQADDIAGMQALYGVGSPPGLSPSPSPPPTGTPVPAGGFRLTMPVVAREP